MTLEELQRQANQELRDQQTTSEDNDTSSPKATTDFRTTLDSDIHHHRNVQPKRQTVFFEGREAHSAALSVANQRDGAVNVARQDVDFSIVRPGETVLPEGEPETLVAQP